MLLTIDKVDGAFMTDTQKWVSFGHRFVCFRPVRKLQLTEAAISLLPAWCS